MKTMNSRGFTFVVCLAVCVFGLSLIGCGGGGGGSAPAPKATGIYKIEITSTDSPAFQGHDFPGVGTYDRIQGRAYGLIDPNDPRSQVIVDIALAPTNAEGLVEYSAAFYILTPTDPTKGGKVLFEPPNRGSKFFYTFNQSGGGNNVGSLATDAAGDSTTVPATPATYPGFVFNLGYTAMWSAWDMEPGTSGADQLQADLPIAKNPDGSSITGPVYEYLQGSGTCLVTYYNPASEDTAYATLTRREHLTDTPQIVPSSGWSWGGSGSCSSGSTNANSISLDGVNFTANWIYELVYTAKDPYVATAGFAAMRDTVEFFRYAAADSEGNANPIAGKIKQITVFTLSQPGRLMNDYVWLGFNEDSKRRKIFDGTINYIGGGNGLGINYRFAQVGRTLRARQNHIAQLEAVFPFSYTTTTDPFTGITDGRNVRCTATNTCPKIMNLYSSNEVWVKAASLATTDPVTGLDVQEPANVRNYVVAGSQHSLVGGASPAGGVAATAINQFANTTVDPLPVFRALWIRMDEWINGGTPPASKVPSIDQGTAEFVPTNNAAINVLGIGMVPMRGASGLGFPNMPAGLITVSDIVATVHPHFNFGPRYAQGILDIVPGIPTGNYYKISVSKVDNTGNEIGGLRLPEVVAPIGSNFGWTLRAPGNGGKLEGTDGSDGSGAFIPLAPFKDDADEIGDGRKSLEELYGTVGAGESLDDLKAAWLVQYLAAADALLAEGFLLPNDHANYETTGKAARTIGANYFYPNMYNFTWPASP